MQRLTNKAVRLIVTSVLLGASYTPVAVYAQDADADAEAEIRRTIEEVIVTAERREASVQDTSISITALTSEMLEDFGVRNQEDLQNFVPGTTIQHYDATIRGVGRNFRALGGDPGVATYMNGIYSEDLLTATAATFWDVSRIEILRGPQGTLYGRNAVGGAINILYNEPSHEFDYSLKSIVGNFGTNEFYGMLNGSLIEDQLSGRINFSYRDRDGVIDDLGGGGLDGLGTENVAAQFQWTPSDDIEVNFRQNFMDIDRSLFLGHTVINEAGGASRSTWLTPGYRFIDTTNTDSANYDQNNFYDQNQPILTFTNPATGVVDQAQRVRPGIDFGGFNGFQNAAASLDGFNNTSDASAARLNECVFPGDISGDDVCAATNGVNNESFRQQGTQFNVSWDVNDRLELKYLYGYNRLTYEFVIDNDLTASQFHDRQFYVNHEAEYSSHELQAFYDVSDTLSFTSGVFFYDASIDQRGDFYSTLGERRYIDPYVDNTALSQGASDLTGIPVGTPASWLLGFNPMATLFSAKQSCNVASPAASCQKNNGGLNLYTSQWYGDDGTNPGLNVIHGNSTLGSDLLYATQTNRDAFAAYTQGVWDINDIFTLTFGLRYAWDDVDAEENLFRYSETGGDSFLALYGGLAAVNRINGGLVDDGTGALIQPTEKVTNGGVPFALSIYRPFQRKDEKVTGRINLDWDINNNAMMYFSATSGYRSGGFNLVFFSQTNTYDPEELMAYEIGYKTRWLDNTLQLNGSFYLYDYDNIHTAGTEVSVLGDTSASVLEAPGAKVIGVEAELLYYVNDALAVGGNFSFNPSEYTETLRLGDSSNPNIPGSLYSDFDQLTQDIKGNQLLRVPEWKTTAWASYDINLNAGAQLKFLGLYSYIDEVYQTSFEFDGDKADAYDRLDLRATYTSSNENWIVSAFVNNVFDDAGILQLGRGGESAFFRHSARTTVPRLYGMEFTYQY